MRLMLTRDARLRRLAASARQARTAGISLLLVLVAAVALFATLNARKAAPQPLAGTVDSPEVLGRAVLDAFRAGDRARLQSLALTEEEFRDHVWPELPLSRPEVNMPFDLAWGQLAQRSALYLQQTAADFEARGDTLVRVEFAGEATRYDGVTVHRDTELVVTTAAGDERSLRLFGSTIEQDGRYKVFSYVVDN
jgi:hypothetical protein